LFGLICQNKFNELIETINIRINIVQGVCDELMNNKNIKNLLSIILAFGNIMNETSKSRCKTEAFELNILEKLRNIKSTDNTRTLLQHIVNYYLKNFGSEFPLPEPSKINLALNLSFKEIANDFKSLENDLKKVEGATNSLTEPLKTNILNFIKKSNVKYKEKEIQFNECSSTFLKTVQYFCVKSNGTEVTPKHFFQHWLKFCIDMQEEWN
jgi:formin 2